MKNATSYLKRLQFDQSLTRSIIAKYLANPRLVFLLIVAILILGVASFTNLPRRLNPEIKIPIVIVSTVLPGAGPQDMESLVTVPLENALDNVTDIKTVSSSSRDSVSVISLEFESGVDPERARSDVQSAVDTAALPDDAQTPRVQKLDFENQPVLTFNLATTGGTPDLMRFAEELRDTLENVGTVDNVQVAGLDEQEIQIIISPNAVTTYGLNPLLLQQTVMTSLSSFPAGTVRTDNSTFSLTIDPSVTTVDDIRNLQLNLGTDVVPLSQIATVEERTKPDLRKSYYATADTPPVRSVTFNVFKTESANITTAAKDAEKVIEEKIAETDGQFAVATVVNTGEMIDEQFSELLMHFWITITLIMIVLFIFLGFRQALIVAFSVPLTFLISFTVMGMTGITINFLSLFSLLLSLGLLVDDTIVVVSAMSQYFRSGKFTPYRTGLLVWRDFLVAIFTTTITTVWAFLPLLLSTGIIGEFIKSIPIVVSATLIASFFVAMFITLPLVIILLRPEVPHRVKVLGRILLPVVLFAVLFAVIPKGPLLILEVVAIAVFLFVFHAVRMTLLAKTRERYRGATRQSKALRRLPALSTGGIISFDRVSGAYQRLLGKILVSEKNRKATITMVILFSLFSYLLLPLGFVKNEFFPKADNEYLYLSLELPPGTNSSVSEREAVGILERLRMTKDATFATADVGTGFSFEGGTQGSDANTVLFTLRLPPENKRERSSIEIAETLREQFRDYEAGRLQVIEVSGGPPAGADIQIKLFGDDLKTLDSLADRVVAELETREGITNADKSIKSGTGKLTFVPDQQKLAEQNITADTLGIWLRLFASGITPDTIKVEGDNGDETDIAIRLTEDIPPAESIGTLSIATPQGNVPLTSLGKIRLAPNPTLITREDGKRTISVTAGVRQGYSIPEENTSLEAFANDGLNLPAGYTWQTGGVNEENQNSVNSILQAMIISFILIVLTMVLQFSSFRKALIVMLVIPLSVSGVFIIFALTQTPLSFPALIGMLALFGIVVKNSILVVDKIKQNIDNGLSFTESIVDGAASRLEAIALTSMTAIIGLIPITLSDPLWRGLGGAIIAGLTFSGTIMLFFIPVVYYYWFRSSEGKKRPVNQRNR